MISPKQKKVLAFSYSRYTVLICDGAVRSGKTSLMVVAFIDWAMREFSGQRFGICGKTVGSAAENMVIPYLSRAYAKEKYTIRWRRSLKILEVRRGSQVNYFEVFGGRDESSFALIQGRTLAGVLLDEAALMPRSFVEQALARCSVEGARLWFNCNPDVPTHWFRQEWLLKLEEKNATHLHFRMEDNPSLSPETLEMYRSLYTGVFKRRYIDGEWTAGDGLIYDMFDETYNTYDDSGRPAGLYWTATRYIACDYGTANPFVLLDIYDDGEVIWVDNEYRWSSRETLRQKTDGEYGDDLQDFMGRDPQYFCPVIVDPSAASFIAELQRRGVYVIAGDNDVPDGIRRVSSLLGRRIIRIHRRCEGLTGELCSYVWDSKAALAGVEKPVKNLDHGPDALRYYVNTCLPKWRYGEEG